MKCTIVSRVVLGILSLGATSGVYAEALESQVVAIEMHAVISDSVDVSALLPPDSGRANDVKSSFALRLGNAIQSVLHQEASESELSEVWPVLSQKIMAMRPAILSADTEYLEVKAEEVAHLIVALARLEASLPIVDKKTLDGNLEKLGIALEQVKGHILGLMPPFITVEQVDLAAQSALKSAQSSAIAADVPYWKRPISQDILGASLESFSQRYTDSFPLLDKQLTDAANSCKDIQKTPEEGCAELQSLIRQGLDDTFGWIVQQLAYNSFDEDRRAVIAAHLETPELMQLQSRRAAMEAAQFDASQAAQEAMFQEIMKIRRDHLMAGTPDKPIYLDQATDKK